MDRGRGGRGDRCLLRGLDGVLDRAHFEQGLNEIDIGIGKAGFMYDRQAEVIARRREIALFLYQAGEIVMGVVIVRMFFDQRLEGGPRLFLASGGLIHGGEIVAERHIVRRGR